MENSDLKVKKTLFIGAKPIDKIAKIINDIDYLPSKPLQMFKILRMAYVADKNIAEELTKDKAILARVLNLSSIEDMAKHIDKDDFVRAVSSLDKSLIQNSLEIDCAKKYAKALQVDINVDLREPWFRAVRAAIIAKAIANWVGYEHLELAFMTSLLKSIPGLVLRIEENRLEEKIDRVVEQGIERKKAEVLVRGFTEFEFGSRLFQFYSCPSPVVDLMEKDFNPSKANNPMLAHIVNFAELISTAFGDKEQSPSALWTRVQAELEILGLELTKENWADKISWLFVKSLEFEEAVSR
jgi:HD-like signal output (HDOD) protein